MRTRIITIGLVAISAVAIGAVAVHAQRPGVGRAAGPERGPRFAQQGRGGGGPGFGAMFRRGGPGINRHGGQAFGRGGGLAFGRRGGGPAFGRPGGGPGRGQPGMAMRGLDRALDLTQAQETAIQTIRKTSREAAEPLVKEMRDARAAQHAAIFADAPNDAAIAEAAAKVRTLDDQLAAIHLKAAKETAAALTVEQRAKLKNRR